MNMPAIKKTTETMIVSSKEVCLETNAGNNKYKFMYHLQNTGQNYNIKIANKFLESVTSSNIWEQQ
jgi:hypothetical protein